MYQGTVEFAPSGCSMRLDLGLPSTGPRVPLLMVLVVIASRSDSCSFRLQEAKRENNTISSDVMSYS